MNFRSSSRSCRLFPIFVALVGCAGGSSSLDQGPTCADTTSVIAPTDVPALGFSAADALAALAGPFSSTLSWTVGGTETALTVQVAWEDGEVRYLDSELEAGDSGAGFDGETTCADRFEIDVWLGFITEDGVFNENLPTPLVVTAVDAATFTQDLNDSPMMGTFEVWDYAEAGVEYETLSAELSGLVSPTAGSGQLTLKGSGWEDPSCTTGGCNAWESQGTAATWGEAE